MVGRGKDQGGSSGRPCHVNPDGSRKKPRTGIESDPEATHEGDRSQLMHEQKLHMMAGRSTRQASAW